LSSSHWRLQAGERELARLRLRFDAAQVECERLQGEIELQHSLGRTVDTGAMSIDRQQLFSWLRKSAADRRKTQELRLELRKQQELSDGCRQQLDAQRVLCRKLENRRGKYQGLVQAERRKVRLRQLNFEECEIEERRSWSK
jgi:hypothetical protein